MGDCEGKEGGGAEEKRVFFKEVVLGCGRKVFRVRKVGLRRGGKGSERWSEKLKELIKSKISLLPFFAE